jgi:uncharacterized iron-regulated membrane protein
MKGRSLLVKLHRYLALLAGGVIVLVTLSGGALVFRKEIDARINGRFEAIQPLDHRASLDRVLGNIRAILPGARVAEINFPDRPDGALSLVVSAPDAPWRCVYVDPYTAEVLAVRPPGFLEFLRELHSTLMVGRIAESAVGWYLVGAFGLMSFVLCVTGLYLSWPGARGLRTVLKINRGLSWKRTNWDLHRVAGILASAFIIFGSVSGTVVVFRELFRPAGDPVVLTPGLIEHGGTSPARRWAAPALALDRILRQAEEALPEGQVVGLTVPADPEAPIAVAKGVAGVAEASGVVWLDRRTGAVVKKDVLAEASVASGILGEMMNAIHTGRIAGLPGRFLVLLAGLAPAVLFATGLPIWWTKRRARQQQAARKRQALQGRRPRARDRAAPEGRGGGAAARHSSAQSPAQSSAQSSIESQPARF